MATKVTYDRSIGETLHAQLDTISLRLGEDPITIPHIPPYLDQLSRPWEPKEPPYEEDDEDEE